MKTFKEFINESVSNNIDELIKNDKFVVLSKFVPKQELKKLIGKKHKYVWGGKHSIVDAYYWQETPAESGPICSALCLLKRGDNIGEKLYGYDVLRILEDNGLL